MKIAISSGSLSFRIAFPTAFLFSRIGLCFLRRKIRKEKGDCAALTYKNMRPIYKTVKTLRKIRNGWELVNVSASDGTEIIIKV